MKSLWVGSESGWSGSGSRNGSWQTLTITTIYIDFPGQEKFCRESEAANCNCRNFAAESVCAGRVKTLIHTWRCFHAPRAPCPIVFSLN